MTGIKAENKNMDQSLKYSMIVEYIKDSSEATTECNTECYALGYVFQGSCVLKDDNEQKTLPEGCIYILERGRHLIEHHTGKSGVFEHIMIHFNADSILTPTARTYNPEEERLERTVMSAIKGNMSIEAMADACFMSTSTFKRRFRARYSMSPHRWLLERKLDIAHRIVTTTDIALGEIATLCGFTNTSHFTSSFHRYFNYTPSHIRRSARMKHNSQADGEIYRHQLRESEDGSQDEIE